MKKLNFVILAVTLSVVFVLITFYFCHKENNGILITEPQPQQIITSPLIITGKARGFWYFEAQFSVELYDSQGNFLGKTILQAQDDWMTEDFVPFQGELTFIQPQTSSGILKFLSDNPSGLPQNQKIFELPVKFGNVSTRKVLLYYYNPKLDQDETGNIQCSRNGLVPIEKEIAISNTPIKDTIDLLLKGKENLSPEDIENGITTEYPLEGFSLKEVNLKSDGTLILKLEDLLNKTVGGSCRVGVLWFQIEATAKQFPEVKSVKFLPEELFQP